jgi:hypothetical protein
MSNKEPEDTHGVMRREFVILRLPAYWDLAKRSAVINRGAIAIRDLDGPDPCVIFRDTMVPDSASASLGDSGARPAISLAFKGRWITAGGGSLVVGVEPAEVNGAGDDEERRPDKLHRGEVDAPKQELAPSLNPVLRPAQNPNARLQREECSSMTQRRRRHRYSRVVIPSRILTLEMEPVATLTENGILNPPAT